MANRIKGITVEIGGDTTGLDKALKGVNNTIRTTQSSLKDVSRLLKLDPSNAQLLEQKQKLLSTVIKETSDKLNTLKEADKQAKVQLEQGNLGQERYDALQREIIETEQSLQRLEDEFKKMPTALSASVKQAGKSIKQVGDKTTEVGKKLSTSVTVPLVGIGAASLTAFNEVDEGLDTIVTKTGASGKALDEMKTQMERIATKIPTDFKSAGEAIGEVNTRFGLTGEALESLATQFIKFAQINNVDVSTAIDKTQKVIAAFGLSAEDASLLLDTFNAVGQRTGIGMDTLASLMITNAASLQQLGFTASDAANFLGNVEKSGADTSQVMSGLTKALANATEQGIPMKDALKDIQNSMFNAKTDTEGLQVAYELFGKKAGAAIYQACKNGSINFNELGTSMKENMGSVSETFDGMVDPIDTFQTTMNQLKIVGAEIGVTLMNVLKPILEKIAVVLVVLKQKWDSLSPSVQDAIINFGLLVASLGPLLTIVGSVISFIGTLLGGLTSLGGLLASVTAGFAALTPAILPIIGIAALVVGAITAVILAIKNWGAISTWFKDLWGTLSQEISTIWQSVATFFQTIWNGVATFFSGIWNSMKSYVDSTMNSIRERITSVFQGVSNFIVTIFNTIKTTTTTVWNGIKEAIITPIENAKNKIKQMIDAIVGFFAGMKLSFPRIKLPHFSISGHFSLSPPSVPRLSIDWYKEGGILTKPTIFGMNGSSLMAGGEAGKEAVLPLNRKTLGAIGKGIANTIQTSGIVLNFNADGLVVREEQDLHKIAQFTANILQKEVRRMEILRGGSL